MEVRVEQRGAAANALSSGSPRRRPRPEASKAPKTNNNLLKIIVTGYPPYTQPQDLSRTFSQFGQVTVDKVTPKFAVLCFSDPSEAEDAVKSSNKVNIYGEFLVVVPYSDQKVTDLKAKTAGKRDLTGNKKKDPIVDPKSLDLQGPFDVQLERLLAAVRLTQEEVAALGTLYADLEMAFHAQWPGCTAVPFGSITTGLGVKWSDVDCFVSLPTHQQRAHNNHVNRAKRLLEMYPEVFAEVLAIPRANTPIVKLLHVPTRMRCDVTFKTPLGVQNSRLVGLMLRADPRLLPVAVAVKYWARWHELTGAGRLSNYALTLLLLFYLQQPPLRLLPAVCTLQGAPHRLPVDGWDAGFRDAPLPACAAAASASVGDLLGGFFRFYAGFDFERSVACPLLGRAVDRAAFAEPELLPPELERYRANVRAAAAGPLRADTPLCVQDPLELCHNVAAGVGARAAADLRAHFALAAAAHAAGGDGFLAAILLQAPRGARARGRPEYRVNVFPRLAAAIADPDWRRALRRAVLAVFERVLAAELGEPEAGPAGDRHREKYAGRVTRAVWRRGRAARPRGPADLARLEGRGAAAEAPEAERQAPDIRFALTLTFCGDPRSAVIAMRLGSGDAEGFRAFGKFFMSVMHSWLAALLRPAREGPAAAAAARGLRRLRLARPGDGDGEDEDDEDEDDDDEAEDDEDEDAADSPAELESQPELGDDPEAY